jgi:hypothetical protein
MTTSTAPLLASLSWLDHDAVAAERSMRLMALFEEKEARDELGVGGIRDAISDQLFPGTSTIQTRLRYFLFIPWLFEKLDARAVTSAKYAGAARNAEAELLEELLAHEQDVGGIIGSRARGHLKRMPSSVYWSGLEAWGIRDYAGSLQQYLQDADERRAGLQSARRGTDSADDHEAHGKAWRSEAIQLRPVSFPQGADMAITPDEAAFLLERWRACHPDSLLTWLALELQDSLSLPHAERIWEHECASRFPRAIGELIVQAQRLDALVRGAALLYNLQLAEMDKRDALEKLYSDALDNWAEGESTLTHGWDLADLWDRVEDKGHGITPKTKAFVEAWLQEVKASRKSIRTSRRARELVYARETNLKGASSSRFLNASARKQWGGAAGLAPMSFRWPTADIYLREWHAGLRRENG